MAIYTYFLVPETKGTMLESMPELFKGNARKTFNIHGSDVENPSNDELNESGSTDKYEEVRIERSAA